MKPFNNTPGLCSFNPVPKKELSVKEQLFKAEDDYSLYREDCNKGYCKFEKAVGEKFEANIKKLKKELD